MSYPRKYDRKLFEYVNYLNENGFTVQDKPWEEYKKTTSTWKFPSELEVYYSRMWYNQKELIENKKIFDLGCEIGSKISWFHSSNSLRVSAAIIKPFDSLAVFTIEQIPKEHWFPNAK